MAEPPITTEQRARLLKIATYASVGTALLLVGAKGAAWIITGSVSVLASLIDSLMDTATSLINLLAVRYALAPADAEHRFGHGKAESLAGIAQAMFIVLLLGIAFASLSNGLAIILQREEPLVIMGNMMTLPLMFFSSSMVPASFMPPWLHYAAMANPIEYAVTSVRAVLVTPAPAESSYLLGMVVTAAFAGVTLAWAISAFKTLRS